MKILRYILLLCLNLTCTYSYGMGIGDWEKATSGGHIMGDAGNGTYLRLKNGSEELYLTEWYFYRNHIIGKGGNEYIIVNERTGSVNHFQSDLEWRTFIEQNQLTPRLWTRWYSDNWMDIDGILVLMLFGFIISIPLILLFLWVLFQSLTKERFNIKRPYTISALTVMVPLLLVVVLDYFPDSI